MTPFNAAFSEPLPLTDGSYALSRDLYPDRDQAALEFSAYLGREVEPAALHEDRARWQFAPDRADGDGPNPGWWMGAEGRGSRPVWVLLG